MSTARAAAHSGGNSKQACRGSNPTNNILISVVVVSDWFHCRKWQAWALRWLGVDIHAIHRFGPFPNRDLPNVDTVTIMGVPHVPDDGSSKQR